MRHVPRPNMREAAGATVEAVVEIAAATVVGAEVVAAAAAATKFGRFTRARLFACGSVLLPGAGLVAHDSGSTTLLGIRPYFRQSGRVALMLANRACKLKATGVRP